MDAERVQYNLVTDREMLQLGDILWSENDP